MNRRCSSPTVRLAAGWLLSGLAVAQAPLGLRVLGRLARTSRGVAIAPALDAAPLDQQVTVLLPVLNERSRLRPCLERLILQGPEVLEILVVDGGSSDGTQELVAAYNQLDARVRLLDASPVPGTWNGKAWGLQVGLNHADRRSDWVLTIDADVRPTGCLTRSLLAHARAHRLTALSVATSQEIEGVGEGIVHPALLTTLVYRFGIPGGVARDVAAVQANGQCFLVRRDALEQAGGFAAVFDSICEDVTLARRLVRQGFRVGFYEAGGLVSVRMYDDWRSTWRNWTRSLPMRDGSFGTSGWLGLAEVLLVQAAPLPLLALARGAAPRWLFAVNGVLAATRLGVLAGTARAYPRRPWSYWLSPLADLPAAVQLFRNTLRRRYVWRGRTLVGGRESGRGGF